MTSPSAAALAAKPASAIRLATLALLVGLLASCAAPTLLAPTPLPPTAAPPTSVPATAAPTFTAKPAPDLAETLDAVLKAQVDAGYMSGAVLIGRDGEVLFEKGYGLADREQQIAITPQTKFLIGGLTREFTAMAIMILENQGQVDLQASVCTYVPDCPDAWRPVTLHHLLTNTSGLPEALDETRPLEAGSPPVAQAVALFRDTPLPFEPGTGHLISQPGYVLLAHVIEQVSGVSYEAFLRANIFEPLGMTHTGLLEGANGLAQRYANGYSPIAIANPFDASLWSGAGGLYSTVEDLWLWDQALYTEELLPQPALDRMFTTWVPVAMYGYGWTIQTFEGKRLYGDLERLPGINVQLDRYVDDHLVVITLANQSDANTHFINGLLALKVLKP